MHKNLHFTKNTKDMHQVALEQGQYFLDFHLNDHFSVWQVIATIESDQQTVELLFQQDSHRLMIKNLRKRSEVTVIKMIETKLSLKIEEGFLTIKTKGFAKRIKFSGENSTINLGSDNFVGLIRSFTKDEIYDPNPEEQALDIFVPGQNKSKNYRIPSMIKTSTGRLLAVIDRRLYHQADWGDIDLALRYSDDHGETWSEDAVILDLPKENDRSAFVIDASMVEDKVNQRIHLIVDMFPHSQGFFSVQEGEKPFPYFKGNLVLLDNKKEVYYVDETGKVYRKKDNSITDYKVNMSREDMQSWGDLYKDDEKIGNITLINTDLHMVETAYIYHIYSDDNGITWSTPTDITEQIKADWMYFIGTGPGQGIQMHDDTLVFPIYHTNKNAGYSQSTSLIISEDYGKTWKRQTSPNHQRYFNDETIELETMHNLEAILTEAQVVEIDKVLYLFMRNYSGELCYAYSHDKGQSWSDVFGLKVYDPYCQVSAIAKEDKVFISNPSQTGRRRGTLKTFALEADHHFKKLDESVINKEEFEYSCLVSLDEDHLGILYETKDNQDRMTIKFNKLKINTQL